MRAWLYKVSSVIFVATLAAYLLVWATVSYVGVYITYVAVPIMVVSGLLAFWCAPLDQKE